MFSINGRIYAILSTVYQYVGLNLLYVVSCMPVITIPASTAALFSVARKMVREEHCPIFTGFWRAFRDNLRQSSIIGLLMMLMLVLWWFDSRTTALFRGWPTTMVIVGWYALLTISFSVLLHVFPLMVHMQLKTKDLLSNALFLGTVKPVLTLVNMVIVLGLALLSTKVPLIFLTFYFSVTATLTYWFVDQKLRAILPENQPPRP